MAMLSLSVPCIHLELSAAKSPKEQALLVLSMIPFQGGRKMTELCATRMELDYAFVEFPQLFARASPGFDSAVTLPIRLHIPDDRAWLDVAIGSIASAWPYPVSLPPYPNSEHPQDRQACPKRASLV
jgi:hypothetical protein